MSKKQTQNTADNATGELVDFNFPAFNVTVQAHDIREAEEKLHEILNK